MMKPIDEQQTIQGLIAREEAACRTVLQCFLPPFIAYVRNKFSGEKETATSLMHDALLDVMDNLNADKFTWTGPNSFSAYFFSLAKFKALNFYRDQWRSKKRTQTTSVDWEAEFADLEGILPDVALLEQQDSQDFRLIKQLNDCINQLLELDKRMMTSRYVDGIAWKDIAETLGISAQNARVKNTRLKNQLKKCIERNPGH
jgi:RNA polymerase sigma factor (sigma-70 family)